jgi:hypothetical protein
MPGTRGEFGGPNHTATVLGEGCTNAPGMVRADRPPGWVFPQADLSAYGFTE